MESKKTQNAVQVYDNSLLSYSGDSAQLGRDDACDGVDGDVSMKGRGFGCRSVRGE